MLDMLNVHKVRIAADGCVFDQTNPAQSALRTLLGTFSEYELAEIEQDLSYLARTGVMTARIEELLIEADEDIAEDA